MWGHKCAKNNNRIKKDVDGTTGVIKALKSVVVIMENVNIDQEVSAVLDLDICLEHWDERILLAETKFGSLNIRLVQVVDVKIELETNLGEADNSKFVLEMKESRFIHGKDY